jgi:hypothetical protein
MRNLLAFLAAAVLVFLGLGWYLDWYSFHSVPTESGHRSYNFDINTKKIQTDVAPVGRKLKEELEDFLKRGEPDNPDVPETKPQEGSPSAGRSGDGARIIIPDEEGLLPFPPVPGPVP